MRMSKNGLVVDGAGWFVVNARRSRWKLTWAYWGRTARSRASGVSRISESASAVLEPRRAVVSGCLPPRATRKRRFWCSGECTLIVEDKEQRLTEWDFLYLRARNRAHRRG